MPRGYPGAGQNEVVEEEENPFDDLEEGFLFKPQSESGGLVILLPSKHRESKVTLKDTEGNVLEEGRSSGYANGDREHFRFGQEGSKYPNGAVVEVTLEDGTVMRHKIDDTSMRVESSGVSSGAPKGGGKGLESMSLMGDSPSVAPSVGIRKPNASTQFEQRQQQQQEDNFYFQSPISVLETIRSVSNIIVGSSRSFDSISKEDIINTASGPEDLMLTATPRHGRGGY